MLAAAPFYNFFRVLGGIPKYGGGGLVLTGACPDDEFFILKGNQQVGSRCLCFHLLIHNSPLSKVGDLGLPLRGCQMGL